MIIKGSMNYDRHGRKRKNRPLTRGGRLMGQDIGTLSR